jgi:hypothetical protein
MLDDVGKLLRKEEAGHAYYFGPEALAGIGRRAASLEQGEELYRLVGELLGFASFLLEHKRSPRAATAIVAMIEDLVPRLYELARKDGQAGQSRLEALTRHLAAQRKALKPRRPAVTPPSGGIGVRSKKGR